MNKTTADTVRDSPNGSLHPVASPAILPSPVLSIFSKSHSPQATASTSSLASSPIPRSSFDLYGPSLDKVTEEPQEKEDLEGYTLVEDDDMDVNEYEKCFSLDASPTSPVYSQTQVGHVVLDQDPWSVNIEEQQQYKRHRSLDHTPQISARRFSGRFSSISRRWKNRSGAAPHLSLITHSSLPGSRSGSAASSQIVSPALSAITKYESYLPSSPVRASLDEALYDTETFTIPMRPQTPTRNDATNDEPHATTPLLPPIFTELSKKDSPIHSPLQSPSIAPATAVLSNRTSFDVPPIAMLPSPPLSAKPSVVSMHQRSRGNTASAIPLQDSLSLALLEDMNDPWAMQLGHANFTIHPEPFFPENVSLDTYAEFRANWDHARTNYAKHLARTIEHYGSTSKVFKMTEEKWTSIDRIWKKHNETMTIELGPALLAARNGVPESQDALQTSIVLEKPVTRVVIPAIDDKSGKFPEIGDGDIVGPMTVAPPRNLPSGKKSSDLSTPPESPRKRNLMRFLSEMFGKN